MWSRDRGSGLHGRHGECDLLDHLLASTRAGKSQVLVVRGEAGIGKTALLDYLAGRAAGCRVARASGAESEMGLAFAGLHQLCAPMLDRLDRLPGPQRDALATVFGLSSGRPPDRFLVGLAVLSVLSDAAADEPLVCLIDDGQWLDRVSAQTLAFVARRLVADRVAMVFAVRDPGGKQVLAGCRNSEWRGCATATPECCWIPWSPDGWTNACATGSSPRPAATRSPCSNCRADSRRPSWQVASRCPIGHRW